MFWDLWTANRCGLINAPAMLSTISTPLKTKGLCSCFMSHRLVFLFSWKSYKYKFILRWQRKVLGHRQSPRDSYTIGKPGWDLLTLSETHLSPTAVTPNVHGCGNDCRKTKRGEIEMLPLQLQGSGETSHWKPSLHIFWFTPKSLPSLASRRLFA